MKLEIKDLTLGLDGIIEGSTVQIEKSLRRIYSDSLRDIPEGFFYGVFEKVRRMQFVTLTVLEK